MVISINDNEFEEKVLNSKIPVIVDFWAEWCGPCKQLTPILDDISSEFENKILITKINIDDNPDTPTKLGVRGIPTLMIFKNGERVSVKVGALPRTALTEWIQNHI